MKVLNLGLASVLGFRTYSVLVSLRLFRSGRVLPLPSKGGGVPTLIQGIPSERTFPSENFDVWYVKIGPKMAKLEQFENFGLACFVT